MSQKKKAEKLEASEAKDPNGLSAHEPGAKLDLGKTRLALVLGGFAEALQEVGEVGTKGAQTYTDNGWKQVENGIARYSDAALRHWFADLMGEKFDKKSTQRHLAHLAWNVLALLTLTIKEEKSRSTVVAKKPSRRKKKVVVEAKPVGVTTKFGALFSNTSDKHSACDRCKFAHEQGACPTARIMICMSAANGFFA